MLIIGIVRKPSVELRQQIGTFIFLVNYENFESAIIHNISYMMVAAIRAVLPDKSKGGETSTISAPTIFKPLNPRIILCASMGRIPPISGVPVPGANAGSIPSISNET